MRRLSLAVTICLQFASLFFVTPAHAVAWTFGFQDIGIGRGVAINNVGQVAIVNGTDQGYFSSLYDPQTGLHNIPPLSGQYVYASGLNDLGQVVGGVSLGDYKPQGPMPFTSFIYDVSSGTRDIGGLGGPGSEANGINNAGQVTGEANIPGVFGIHAYRYSPATGMVNIGGLIQGGSSFGEAINASGAIVGGADVDADQVRHAFIDVPGAGMKDLGTLGGTESFAYAINAGGEVAGRSDVAGDGLSHAFFYTSSMGMVDIGGGDWAEFNSFALGLNGSDIVVGGTAGSSVGFVYSSFLGQMRTLTSLLEPSGSGWIIDCAFAINELGQITGSAHRPGSFEEHAFIATLHISAAPEQSTFILMLLGLSGLTIAMSRRRRGATPMA